MVPFGRYKFTRKRHFDRFIRFRTAHGRDQQTYRPRYNGDNSPHLIYAAHSDAAYQQKITQMNL